MEKYIRDIKYDFITTEYNIINDVDDNNFEQLIQEILNKLQARFPDTIIILDPMKTYIFIDWS